ncbi:MAG: hypothetical protein NVSMB64_25530 [Candidatus Velthaea sp.]
MRTAFVLPALLVILAGGCVQIAATSLYGDLAQRPALPALLPPALGVALARPLAAPGMPAALRAAYARALAHRGVDTAAAAIVSTLPAGPTREEIAGTLALHRHDERAAVRAFIAAGDAEQAQAIIDAINARGATADATELEGALSAAAMAHGNLEIRAATLWRLGQLQQTQSYTAHAAADRTRFARVAMTSYRAALELAPNDETFLLSAGNQALQVGDRRAAREYYQRAIDVVPDSADARAGLARAARP